MVKDIISYDKVLSSLMTMAEYYSQKMSEYKVKAKDKSKLATDMTSLEILGFRNTLNYSALSEVKSEITVAENESGIIYLYNEMKVKFPDCIILPTSDFDKILTSNDLVIRPASFFIGSIPVDTLEKIKSHLKAVDNWEFRTKINSNLRHLSRSFKYGRVTLFKYEMNLFLNELDKTGGIGMDIRESFYKLMSDKGYKRSSVNKVWKFIDRNTSYDTVRSSYASVFIACPRSMSSPIYERDDSIYDIKKDQERLRKSQAMDPIVFQYTPAGILVIDSWGKESHNQVLMEHKDRLELNDL